MKGGSMERKCQKGARNTVSDLASSAPVVAYCDKGAYEHGHFFIPKTPPPPDATKLRRRGDWGGVWTTMS
jgi:hypothetical protein